MDVLDDIPQNLRDEIFHFFSVYKTPRARSSRSTGWYEREAAMKVLEDSRKRWEDGQKAD